MKGIKKTGGGNRAEDLPAEGPNPLLNYAILAELMSFLPFPDLRHFRLVNSAWKAAATPYLKKKSCLRIRGCLETHESARTARQSRNSCCPCFNKYLERLCFAKHNPNRDPELTELGLFGIHNLLLNLLPFLHNSSARKIFLEFLQDYGSSLRNLRVNISDGALELLGTVLTSLPNLVSLNIVFELDVSPEAAWHVWPSSTLPRGIPSIKRISMVNDLHSPNVRGSTEANNHYNFLKRLLQIAPNLETLKLKNSLRIQMPNWNADNSYSKQTENLYLRLLKDEGKALCPQLKDLYLSPPDLLSTYDMNLMLKLDINFRQLDLPHIKQSPDVGPFILSLLKRHQSSLEVLKLRMLTPSHTNSSPFPLQFPCLPKLRNLLVEVFFWGGLNVIRFDSVDYATQFPALKDLSVFYHDEESGENPSRFEGRNDFYNLFFPDDGQVCTTLQRLSVQVPYPEDESSGNEESIPATYLQFIRRLALMFPKVKPLDL